MRKLRPYRKLPLYLFFLLPSFLLPAVLLPTLGQAQSAAGATTVPTTLPTIAHNDPQSLRAVAVATTFMNDLIHDSAASTLAGLCSLPFCYDDTVIVLTRNELDKSLIQVLAASAAAAKRTSPSVDSAYVLDIRKEVLFGMVPINIYFTVVRLKFSIQGKQAAKLLILAVQISDEARVVGIQD
jgi:hypothetical protein